MILIKKISIFCVFAFIFCLRPALVESADIDEINIMLKKEKDKLSKLENEIENQTKILNKMDRKEYSNLKKKRILDGQLKVKERELKIYNWNLKINKNNVNASYIIHFSNSFWRFMGCRFSVNWPLCAGYCFFAYNTSCGANSIAIVCRSI